MSKPLLIAIFFSLVAFEILLTVSILVNSFDMLLDACTNPASVRVDEPELRDDE